MMKDGGGKLVAITGTSSGIGRATALHLAKRGYRVLAGVRREADAASLRKEAKGWLKPLLLDVTKPDDIAGAARSVADEGELFALINNAGHNYVSPFEATDWAKARAVMETNLFGLAALTQALLPALRAGASPSSRTRVINISSVGGLIGIPWEPWYHASKFAVIGLSESMRHELFGHHVAVSVICPGGIRTPFIAKSGTEAARTLAALSPEHQSLYGAGLKRLGDLVGAVRSAGSEPIAVARVIRSLLEAKSPKFLALVGADAAMMTALKGLLPRQIFHALFRAIFTAPPRSKTKD